jgi:lipoate-protein ligase A
LTGGGAIYHGDEITFSLVAPSQHPLFAGAVRSSYERVHATLARALEARLPPGVTVSVRCTDVLASDVKGSPWCFHDSTDLDMAAHGRKLVGSAQRRTGGRILHHGSLILRPNRFTPEIASVESLGGDPDPASLERAIVESASRDWNVTLDARQLSASEEHLARELAASKYGSDAWTRRR